MGNFTVVAIVCVSVSLAIVFILLFRQDATFHNIQCSVGYFRLPGMSSCHPWLTCSDLKYVVVKELIGFGAVKAVYKGMWKNISVVYSLLNNPSYYSDFNHGLNILKLFNPSPYVIQLVGFCEVENVILTEYHKYGNAVNITNFLSLYNIDFRVKLCLNYALILEYLHNSPVGTRVMCDSNDLMKLLSQLLVTDKMKLILNDVDALPRVDLKQNITIKCGHNQLFGTFVAPEQLWPFKYSYDDNEMSGYDEKTDIWKAASVCDHFLGNDTNGNMARYLLFSLHKSCKHSNPKRRPTAVQLVNEYRKVLKDINSEL